MKALVFNPGEDEKAILIEITDDGVDEDDETIIVTLKPTGAVQLGEIRQHTYTIIDPRPTVEFLPGNPFRGNIARAVHDRTSEG